MLWWNLINTYQYNCNMGSLQKTNQTTAGDVLESSHTYRDAKEMT